HRGCAKGECHPRWQLSGWVTELPQNATPRPRAATLPTRVTAVGPIPDINAIKSSIIFLQLWLCGYAFIGRRWTKVQRHSQLPQCPALFMVARLYAKSRQGGRWKHRALRLA